jgi:ubiquinone/menaquinone biosynthesis C-methylase UbiE
MYNSVPQHHHALLPTPGHDEMARQMFARDMRRYALLDLPMQTRKVYEHVVKPGLEQDADHHRVRDAMWQQGFLRATTGLQRISQDLLWNSVVPYVERNAEAINAAAEAQSSASGEGSLNLDPDFKVPEYLTEVDIHCMPGNYHQQYAPGDAAQGAVFDRGAFIYGLGGVGELHDGVAKAMIRALRDRYPDIDPTRIADLGCTIGHNTLPLCDEFPGAEIHAVDAAEPMLRYAHGRARALHKAVHWHQADVRATGFPDDHFDLVVSSILFHEVEPEQIPAVLAECYRILAPGGVMAHVDIPDYFKSPDPLFVALVDADHFHNNEPFWGTFHKMDLESMMVDAGFPEAAVFRGVAPLDGFPWSFFGAKKDGGSAGAGA